MSKNNAVISKDDTIKYSLFAVRYVNIHVLSI